MARKYVCNLGGMEVVFIYLFVFFLLSLELLPWLMEVPKLGG